MADLEDSGRFPSLDVKLGAAITSVSHGELGRKLTHENEAAAREGKMIKGRQLLWYVYEYYKVSEEAGTLYDLQDLMAVTLVGDGKLSQFMQTWESILAGMKEEPAMSTQEILFLKQVRSSKELCEEIAHYDRVERGHVDKSYAYLVKSVKRLLERRRQEKN